MSDPDDAPRRQTEDELKALDRAWVRWTSARDPGSRDSDDFEGMMRDDHPDRPLDYDEDD